MKGLRYIVILLGIAILTAGALQAQEPGVLHVVTENDITTLDPAIGYDLMAWTAEPLVYRGLVVDDASGNISGALADKWDVSSDGLTYSFHIRDGAKFSNGRQVTADDVKYTFTRFFDPATQSPGTFIYDMIQGAKDEIAGTTKDLSGVQVIDASDVKFILTRPEYTFLIRLALPFDGIIAKEGVDKAGADFAHEPLGAGPFMLDSWDAGQQATFVKNPNYYDADKVPLDKIVFDIGVDAATGYLRVESGQADLSMDRVTGADYTHVASDPNLASQLIKSIGFPAMDYITMNVTEKPYSDPQVRQALNMAIDRDHLVQVTGGLAAPENGIVPPVVPGHNADIPVIKYDPDGAKALLAKAGYPNGFSATMLTYNQPDALRLTQAMVQDLSQIGVNITLDTLDIGPYLDAYYKRPSPYDLIYGAWGMDFSDPTDAYEPLLLCGESNNPGGYCNADLDKQEQADAQIPPGDARWKAFMDLEDAYTKDMPWIYGVYPISYFFRSSRVQNLNSHPAFIFTF
ncbi:MAG TPA: ABC transporter substrate-binding protein, partial [Phototrophicaceae bacterium]|nr:ABC transporter substrate-binding protein [Phototrophicaceae bacterium]